MASEYIFSRKLGESFLPRSQGVVRIKRISSSSSNKFSSTFYLSLLCLHFYSLASEDWGLKTKMGIETSNTFPEALSSFRIAISFRFFNWLTHNRDVFAAYRASLGYIWA